MTSCLLGTLPTSQSGPFELTSAPPPSPPATTVTIEGPNPQSPTVTAAAMLTALPSSNVLTSDVTALDSADVAGGFDDHLDNGSSSLSELGDGSDVHSEPTPRASTAADLVDMDSEAETERLEATPRKLTRTATETSLASEQMYGRTPSKLIHSRTVDDDESVPASPDTPTLRVSAAISGNAGLDALSFLAASEAASLEIAGKKRKRSSADSSSVDELVDEPARKRSATLNDAALNGRQEELIDNAEQIDVEEELDHAEERISALAQEEAELEERQADVAAETVNELATVAKLTKPRKGGRRGKRKLDESGGIGEAIATTEVQEGEGEDNEEEDSSALDEEGKYSVVLFRVCLLTIKSQ